MKYAFMTFSCPEKSWDDVLATARELGYQGVEPRAQSDHRHGVEISADSAGRKAIRAKAEAAGVQIACLATSCRYADPATAAENVESTRQLIDLAGDIGCRRLRVFGGDFTPAVTRQQATRSLVESLRSLGDAAAGRHVTLCLETHDSWCDPQLVADVMRQVDHPAVAVNWDVMHPVRSGGSTMRDAYRLLKPWIRHVHVHDGLLTLEKLVMLPIGQGELDHRVVIDLLQQDRYDGFISGEWIANTMSPEFYQVHLKQELAALRGLERSC